MRRGADGRFTVRVQAITLTALCLLAVGLSGCSSSKPPASAKVIDKEQFQVLQKARGELGSFIQDSSTALNPTYALATRLEQLNAVIAKYKGKFPKPEFAALDQRPADFNKKLEGTLTGDLLEFNKTVTWNPKEGGKASDAISAWYVANDYLTAVDYLYGLQDFEKYIIEHTTEEGTRSNTTNPIDNMESGMKVFGSEGFPSGGISVNTTVDAATGLVTYRLLNESDIVEEVPLGQIENAFITGALKQMQQGSDLLLDRARL